MTMLGHSRGALFMGNKDCLILSLSQVNFQIMPLKGKQQG
jgi:hypothetical protein